MCLPPLPVLAVTSRRFLPLLVALALRKTWFFLFEKCLRCALGLTSSAGVAGVACRRQDAAAHHHARGLAAVQHAIVVRATVSASLPHPILQPFLLAEQLDQHVAGGGGQ